MVHYVGLSDSGKKRQFNNKSGLNNPPLSEFSYVSLYLVTSRLHAKLTPQHHGMARSQAADRGNGLHI
jgi:hypothetical protein